MKELNLPENQLRGWQPRRPSAGLKRRIFEASADEQTLSLNWIRLAPAMLGLFLVMMAAHFNSGGIWPQHRITSASLTNQNYVFYDGDSGHVSENHLAGVTFDWTNRSGFQSSIGFAPKTNSSN